MGSLLNFGRHRLPVIQQAEAAECGLACLAMVASYHGHRVDLGTLRRRYPISLKGVTLRSLMQLGAQMHLTCRALRFELPQVRKLRTPAIVHWDMQHFVVLKSASRKGIEIHDPAMGARFYSLEEASKHVTGVALELVPAPTFVRRDDTARLPLRAFWRRRTALSHALLQVFLLSVALEVLTIAGPFYSQLALDEVVARGDLELLPTLAVGFGLLAAMLVACNALRSLLILVLQNAIHFEMGARLFHHLLRLPLNYFEKRHIGDLVSRFHSLEPIRNLLAEGMISAAIDGMMALATLVMIFLYSPRLAAVVVGAVLLYALLRVALYRTFLDRSQDVIQSMAQENSSFIESARAIQSIKLFGRESEREERWLNRYADVVNANVRLGRAKVTFKTFSEGLLALENVVTIYLAVHQVLAGAMTVGMVFAFISYKKNFSDKMVNLIERGIDFRLLDLHLERLSDIALSPLERGYDLPPSYERPIRGGIELRDVCFRYADSEPFVLENVNLRVEPGSFVTITGPSGGGKTTLLKVMLGLLEPTSGEVLIDGIPLRVLGSQAYRKQVAAVMQEDQLLSGTIADNISFFDAQFDQAKMVLCAEMAGIHEEVMAMPMGYNSLIGDMGSTLSGGQKQRVLLARALYREPKILFLDEGTAHLDVDNEREINRRLQQLKITRVNIAHRPEMLTGAERTVQVGRVHR